MSVSDDDADVKGNAVDATVGAEVVPPSMAEVVALITAETDAIAIAENALKKGVDKSMEESRVLDKSAEVLEEVEKQEVEKQEVEKQVDDSDAIKAIEQELLVCGQDALEGALLGKGTPEESLARIARSFAVDEQPQLESSFAREEMASRAFDELAVGGTAAKGETPKGLDSDSSQKIAFTPVQSKMICVYVCVRDILVGQ